MAAIYVCTVFFIWFVRIYKWNFIIMSPKKYYKLFWFTNKASINLVHVVVTITMSNLLKGQNNQLKRSLYEMPHDLYGVWNSINTDTCKTIMRITASNVYIQEGSDAQQQVCVWLKVTGYYIINITRLLFVCFWLPWCGVARLLKSCQYAKVHNAAPAEVMESLQLPASRWSSAQFEQYLGSTVYLPYTFINPPI